MSPTRPANDVDLSYRELACPGHMPQTAVPTATPTHVGSRTTRNILTEANVKFTITRLTVEVHTIVVIESSRLRAGSRCDLHPWSTATSHGTSLFLGLFTR